MSHISSVPAFQWMFSVEIAWRLTVFKRPCIPPYFARTEVFVALVGEIAVSGRETCRWMINNGGRVRSYWVRQSCRFDRPGCGRLLKQQFMNVSISFFCLLAFDYRKLCGFYRILLLVISRKYRYVSLKTSSDCKKRLWFLVFLNLLPSLVMD